MSAINITPLEIPSPPPTTDDPVNFPARADNFVAYIPRLVDDFNTNVPELNKLISGLDQTTPIAAYDAAAAYNFPDCVACINGHTYRCISDTPDLVGINPITDTDGNWVIVGYVQTPKPLNIDGDFNFWYEGTSQSISGYGSDTMSQNNHVGSTKVHSRQTFTPGQSEVPGNPKYYSRTAVTSVAGAVNYVVKKIFIEDVATLAGKTVTLSSYMKADANKYVAFEGIQYFGISGSSSIDKINPQKVLLTPSWGKILVQFTFPSIAGKTVGTGSFSYINIWFESGSTFDARTASIGQQSGTFDIARVRLVDGVNDGDSIDENYAETLQKIKRYYQDLSNQIVLTTTLDAAFANRQILPVEMRLSPTVTMVVGGGTGASILANTVRIAQNNVHSINSNISTLILDARL